MTFITKDMSSNLVHGEVCSLHHYVIKFVSYLRQVGGFHLVIWFSLSKSDRHDIAKILLKVTLNTITITIAHTISKTKLSM